MAGFMIAEVWCDVCNDPREVAEDEGTLREHRAYLREGGWRRWRGDDGLIDVCPDCVDDVWAWHLAVFEDAGARLVVDQ